MTNSNVVWVTGSRGFIGSALTRRLLDTSRKVGVVGHGAYTMTEARKLSLSGWIDGDIERSNLDYLQLQTGAPDCIIHLAGGASVGKSLSQPAEDFRRTVLSTVEVLEWIRLTNPKTKLVYVSSAAVYGAKYQTAIAESFSLNPYSPYGTHKCMAEDACRSYAASFGIASVIIRPFSVYGPGLKKQLIFDICERLANNSAEISMQGTGNEYRDWIYIDDLVNLLIMSIGWATDQCESINAGAGIGVPVFEIVQTVCGQWNPDCKISFSGVSRPGDPVSLVADITLAESRGFRATTGWKDGIERTARAYKAYLCS